MNGDDEAFGARLRRLAAQFAEDERFELDEETVTRLLRRNPRAEDVPPGYAEMAEVLKAVTAPARPGELRREADAVAAFRAAHQAREAHQEPLDSTARPASRSRWRSVPVVAAVTAFTVGASGLAAAAAGVLPAPMQELAHAVLGDLGVPPPHPAAPAGPEPAGPVPMSTPTSASNLSPRGTGPTSPTDRPSPGGHAAAGPSAGPDLVVLCQKWALRSEGKGPRLEADELDRLAAAAGGADRIGAACENVGSDDKDMNDRDDDKEPDQSTPSPDHSPGQPSKSANPDPPKRPEKPSRPEEGRDGGRTASGSAVTSDRG